MKPLSKIALIGCLVFSLSGCNTISHLGDTQYNGPRSTYFNNTASTDLQNESVADLQIGKSTKDESFQSTYGKQLTKAFDHDEFDYYALNENITIATNQGTDKIIRITLQNDATGDLHSAKGIRFGDAKEKVIAAYGNEYYTRSEQGASVIGYVDQSLHQSLEFWLFEGKVQTIRLDETRMK